MAGLRERARMKSRLRAQCAHLHDALEVGAVAVLAGDEDARRRGEAVGDGDLFHLGAEHLLQVVGERLEVFGVQRLARLFGLVVAGGHVEALLGDGLQAVAVVLGQVLHGVLVNGVGHVQHLEVLGAQLFEEGRVLHGGHALAGDVVDELLAGRHVAHVVVQRAPVRGVGGGDVGWHGRARAVAQQLGELGPVGAVFDDAELDVLAVELPELGVRARGRDGRRALAVVGVGLLLQRQAADHLEHLAHELLAEQLQDFRLLQLLATCGSRSRHATIGGLL